MASKVSIQWSALAFGHATRTVVSLGLWPRYLRCGQPSAYFIQKYLK
ncbi:MAG: hypothetical protein F6J90_11240 [Moorea sp. SIOASIH]|nr:hypothetical protein [Moorena sp. SIOASIH]NEO36851.1 hypothetical protein [Moorena sp. SIOASIH]NEO90966.1 hypothetical protein [Moorena sp. SIO3G5]